MFCLSRAVWLLSERSSTSASITYNELTRSLGKVRRDGAEATSHHLIGAIMKINDNALPLERHKNRPFHLLPFNLTPCALMSTV